MENNNININVESNFIKERSSSAVPIYLFSYNIEIYNERTEKVQLLSRYWHITDGNGHIDEIRGPGVVGLKPFILSESIKIILAAILMPYAWKVVKYIKHK